MEEGEDVRIQPMMEFVGTVRAQQFLTFGLRQLLTFGDRDPGVARLWTASAIASAPGIET